jgi:hypothetical protein
MAFAGQEPVVLRIVLYGSGYLPKMDPGPRILAKPHSRRHSLPIRPEIQPNPPHFRQIPTPKWGGFGWISGRIGRECRRLCGLARMRGPGCRLGVRWSRLSCCTLFQFGPKSNQIPPIFGKYPLPYNTILNTTGSWPANAIYLLGAFSQSVLRKAPLMSAEYLVEHAPVCFARNEHIT